MRRILLRAPRDTFDIRSPSEVLTRNLIADNAGNLLFIGVAQKILSAPGVSVEPDGLQAGGLSADAINERFDHYVLPLANAFRPVFEGGLLKYAALLGRLRIPVTVLGVAAQTSLDGDVGRLRRIEPAVRAFARAVLDRGPTIGVRGEVTADYLHGLGFHEVEVVGCPSIFAGGPSLPAPRVRALAREDRVALTLSPYVTAMRPIVAANLARYPRLEYVAQDLETMELLAWGLPWRDGRPDDPLPLHPDHPLIREGRTRLYVDPWPWVRDLGSFSASFGTRIHGSIAAVLAGTPVVVLAHDSRTLELARYLDIPHRPIHDVPPDVDPAALIEAADFGPLTAGHAARWQRFAGYLARHGLDHVFAHEGAAAAFDARIAATSYPPPMTGPAPGHGAPPLPLAARVDEARFRLRRSLRRGRLRRLRLATLRSAARAAVGGTTLD